jgi:hypothetical protein
MSRIKKPPGGLNKGVHAALSLGSFETPMRARRLVGTPDARFGTYLLEQFGGPTGASRVTYQCEPRLISSSDQSGRQGE